MMAEGSRRAGRLAGQIRRRGDVLNMLIGTERERIARICFDMARAFSRGGTLIAFGTDAATTDAAHVAVEFMHPVIVGKRALPALALSNDPSAVSESRYLVRDGDIALGLTHTFSDPTIESWLRRAGEAGALTIAFAGSPPRGRDTSLTRVVDHALIVPDADPWIVQEVQETAYHVLWELVHVFFEHPGLLDDACITCGDVAVEARVVSLRDGSAVIERDGAREHISVDLVDGVSVGDTLLCHAGVALQKLPSEAARTAAPEPTNFLYPFLDSEEDDLERVMVDLGASTVKKADDVTALRAGIDLVALEACAASVHERLERGGRLITFGNGGSSTDAQDLATDALHAGWPAIALTNDVATVTAVANDVGFDNIFARQLIALARPADVAIAISTSGSSPNVVAGLLEARKREMLTCAITGYDGGRLVELDWLDHLFVVGSDYIPRLQEAHATIYHLLLELIGDRPR